MKLVRFFVSALLIGAVISFTACSDDEDDVVNSSTDEPSTEEPSTGDDGDGEEPGDEDTPDIDYGEGLSFVNGGATVYFYDYGETIEVGLVSTEAWTATVDGDWATVTPASGNAGESTNVQYLSVTADRNTENTTRDCTLTVTGETDEISLTLSQDPQNIQVSFVERVGHLDCYFGYAYYTFSYSGVAPGDEITVSGTVTGNNDISLPTVTVTATDRSGTVDIPFQVGPEDFDFSATEGTPLTTPGSVSTTASVSILDVVRCEYQATETVYVMVYDCAKFTLGGDYVGQKDGVMAEGFYEEIYPSNSDWQSIDWIGGNYETVSCGPGFCAFSSIIDYDENVYRAFNFNRGTASPGGTAIGQWYGTQDHAFYRQLAIGSAGREKVGFGTLMTPYLGTYVSKIPCTVRVSIDICPAVGRDEWTDGWIQRRGGTEDRVTVYYKDFENLKTISSEDELHWETITFEMEITESGQYFRLVSSNNDSTGDDHATNSTIFITNYLIEEID